MGNWIHLEVELATLVRNGFLDLFCTSHLSSQRSDWRVNNWPAYVSLDEGHTLSTLVSMKPFKAPGLDGLHAGSFNEIET